ncbi:hypothetical protein D3C71_258990 [compost metagenome]
MAASNIIPEGLIELSTRFGTLPATPRGTTFDPVNVLQPRAADFQLSCLPVFRGRRFASEILDVLAMHVHQTATMRSDMVRQAASMIYNAQARRHAYDGTIILSLLDRIESEIGDTELFQLQDSLRRRRGEDPQTWELVRHFGRPSVPQHVLPVFAIYAAEKKLGRGLPKLSREQLHALGLA